MNREFAIEDALGQGWSLAKKHFLPYLILLLISIPLWWVAQHLDSSGKHLGFFLGNPLRIIAWLLRTLIACALSWLSLRVHDGRSREFRELFSPGRRLFDFLLSQALYQLTIAGGLILLIVPGIMWAVQFQFAGLAALDEGLGPVAALKRSSELTAGIRGRLFLFDLALLGVNLLGALALLVGLFASIPLTVLAHVSVYRALGRKA